MGAGRGFFIVFEGIEGSGKTTQIKKLSAFLQENDITVISTREPGGTPLSDNIREILLSNHSEKVNEKAELLLYLASRAQHVNSIIKPALYQGITVLCDRFADATIAYQGFGRGLDIPFLNRLNRYATDGLTPDLTILLDLPASEGIGRIRRVPGRDMDRLESEGIEFHEKVRRGYLELARSSPERFTTIDATRPIENIHELIKTELEKRFRFEKERKRGD